MALKVSSHTQPREPGHVKLLLLQQWYGLSDPGLEEVVDDRLSFRRFAGLPLDESVPDHSTIWRFRQELAAHRLAEALFEEINRQLDARGLIVRQGTLIDATLLQASVKPPSVKEGPVSERDAEAGWTKKNGKSHFGYKAHVAVDEGSEIIRTASRTRCGWRTGDGFAFTAPEFFCAVAFRPGGAATEAEQSGGQPQPRCRRGRALGRCRPGEGRPMPPRARR